MKLFAIFPETQVNPILNIRLQRIFTRAASWQILPVLWRGTLIITKLEKILVMNNLALLFSCILFYSHREKNSLLASQRRLERKLKELNMTLDEERETHSEQRDQVHTLNTYYTHDNLKTELSTRTSFSPTAYSASESFEEAGGWRRNGAGKDRGTEEKGSERHGGTDGAQGLLAV